MNFHNLWIWPDLLKYFIGRMRAKQGIQPMQISNNVFFFAQCSAVQDLQYKYPVYLEDKKFDQSKFFEQIRDF